MHADNATRRGLDEKELKACIDVTTLLHLQNEYSINILKLVKGSRKKPNKVFTTNHREKVSFL